MESFDLRAICSELLAELNESNERKNIIKLGVDIQLPDTYYGRPDEFLQPLHSAINYLADTLINGIIAIEITLLSTQGSEITLHAHITGTGSTSGTGDGDKLDLVIHQSNKKISSKIVDGKIVFEFNHTLRPTHKVVYNTKYPLHSKKVLLVEDNNINAEVFTSFLEEWGCHCTVAVNGAQAVLQVHDEHYDGVLMDIHMPVLNGNLATSKIREFNPTIPIIALTASTREEDIREALRAGVNDYLLKPVSSVSLFNLLVKYL